MSAERENPSDYHFMTVRHVESTGNLGAQDPRYQNFSARFKALVGPVPEDMYREALELAEALRVTVPDRELPLAQGAGETARKIAAQVRNAGFPPPTRIIRTDTVRTAQTHEAFISGWPELMEIPWETDDRLLERNTGAMTPLTYVSDLYFALNPDEHEKYKLDKGFSWRPLDGGENIMDVFYRVGASLEDILTRYPKGERILFFMHGISLVVFRLYIEYKKTGILPTAEDFNALNESGSGPRNGSITTYVNSSNEEKAQILLLDLYGVNASELKQTT